MMIINFIFDHPVLSLFIVAFVIALAVGFYKDWEDPVE